MVIALLQYKHIRMDTTDICQQQAQGAELMTAQPDTAYDHNQPATPLLVRVEEAARLLSLSRSTIYEMMNSGELAFVRRGAARRIPLAAIHRWIATQTEPLSPQARESQRGG